MKRQYPTIAQANGTFLLIAVITLLGSIFFQPRLGIGTNLWINELVYILLPPLLIVKLFGWSEEDVFKFKKASARNKLISSFAGFSMWFFVFYINKLQSIFLDNQVGELTSGIPKLSVYQILLYVIGTVILAPICEEILFRGFMQMAYDRCFKKYGFVIVGFIFGYLHIMNGVTNVIPATVLGISMGYLVYKTGSILTSIIFHAMNNLTSVLLSGALTFTSISLQFHILGISGLLITLILLKCIKAEPKPDDIIEEVAEKKRLPLPAFVILLISWLYLSAIGIFEILSRMKVI